MTTIGFSQNNSQIQQNKDLETFPPSPNNTYQEKPTSIEISNTKYNAFNVDKLKFQIVGKQGFDKITPDLMVWNEYVYNVQNFVANADENELSNLLNWALNASDIENVKVDFSEGGKTEISGKYKVIGGLPLPFKVDINIKKTEDNNLIFTFNEIKSTLGVSLPDKIRDYIVDSLLDLKEGPGVGKLRLTDAFFKISDNEIMFAPEKLNPKVKMPISFFETTDDGFSVHAGTEHFKNYETKPDKVLPEKVNDKENISIIENPKIENNKPEPVVELNSISTLLKIGNQNKVEPKISQEKPKNSNNEQTITKFSQILNIQ